MIEFLLLFLINQMTFLAPHITLEYKGKRIVILWHMETAEHTDWDVFCFFRDAETVGLDTRSYTGWDALNLAA